MAWRIRRTLNHRYDADASPRSTRRHRQPTAVRHLTLPATTRFADPTWWIPTSTRLRRCRRGVGLCRGWVGFCRRPSTPQRTIIITAVSRQTAAPVLTRIGRRQRHRRAVSSGHVPCLPPPTRPSRAQPTTYVL